jgi:peptidyl-tRNA hydrolase ICT1
LFRGKNKEKKKKKAKSMFKSLWPCPRPICRHLVSPGPLYAPIAPSRSKRYEAFGSELDQDALAAARSWYQTFTEAQLPSGSTTYARSSGPGGQHVNKTETKAITNYPVRELLARLPPALHGAVRASKYYTASSDSLTFHAQTSRSRTSNTEENRQKLLGEVTRMYRDCIPSETGGDKKKKHEEVEKKFHAARMKDKKLKSAKKASRRGSSD